jgi:hypothetical protein
LLLLQAVDPENETRAPLVFWYKQLLHEPIMGGGLDLYRRSVDVTPGKLAGFHHQRDCYCFLDCGIVVLEKGIGIMC